MGSNNIRIEAIKNYENAVAYEKENRDDFIMSNSFTDGNQWPVELKNQRISESRPCLTSNKLRKFAFQILGEIQQSRIELDVAPLNSQSTVEIAAILNRVISYIERISKSHYAYDRATYSALSGGWGHWRLRTQYKSEYEFDQDIIIDPIQNPLSVFLDPYMKSNTGFGAEWGMVVTDIPRYLYEKKYKKKIPTNFDVPYGTNKSSWFNDESVRLAEYYWKEYETKDLIQMSNGDIIFLDEFEDRQSEYFINNIIAVNSKEVRTNIIKWIKMSMTDIIEGPQKVAGKHIPIVKVCGYEHNDMGYTRLRSLVHDALDPMRMFNYWRTYITEMIALAPKSPYIMTADQIKGWDAMWKQANVKLFPYLVYNHVPNVPKPDKEKPFQIPTAAVTEANVAAADINDVIGMFAPSVGEPSNERSGRAILARQAQANNTIFPFINNFQEALIYSGNILLEMIPEVYDTPQMLKILTKEGIEDLKLNYPQFDPVTLVNRIENDLSIGKYEMVPKTGPYYATRRQQTAANMLDVLQFAPHTAPIIIPKLAKLLDWEGASKLGEELEALNQQMALSGGNMPNRNTAAKEFI